ncbi:MAG: mannose-6-phosphate isomerase [Chloroflexia bacterium]|nr:mannose-6-phosphate isomerase [Chloroflexia bacterium]MBA3642637.1 mannose-6-phosphate isomerase [Chloroflexia bacterium]
MRWYPLKLSVPVRHHTFGARLIPDKLNKAGLPDGVIAETWEFSDVPSAPGIVTNGELAGQSLHALVERYPDALVGEGWRGPRFPLLGKFLDASHLLPVHLHADDATAKAVYGEPNGKTEAWHILWCADDASILAGVKPGLSDDDLRAAFLAEDYDRVMYRHPIIPGDTVYIPGGVLHTFGPDTLIFEIQQTSDIAQSVMPTDLAGNRHSDETWRHNIEATLRELRRDPLPRPTHGLEHLDGNNRVTTCAAGPHFAMERWKLTEPLRLTLPPGRCATLTNLVEPVGLTWEGGTDLIDRAESRVLPAALGEVTIVPDGLAYVLVCYVPDLTRDIIAPLHEAGYGDGEIAALGEVKRG